jgi:hypothetical protein
MQYHEPWRLKPTGSDTFASYGPDRGGRMVQIRTGDGEHFTVAGEDIVGGYLYPKIVTALAQMGTQLERACGPSDKPAADSPADATAGTRAERKQEP